MEDWGEHNPLEQVRIEISFACISAYLLYISRDSVTSKASLEKTIHRAEEIQIDLSHM